MAKKSYRNDIIRWGSIALGILVFFAGPHFVTSAQASDIDYTIEQVKKAKVMTANLRKDIIEQLDTDKKFIKQNSDPVTIASVKLPAVYWLAFLIIAIGNLIPLVMKYFENKRAKNDVA